MLIAGVVLERQWICKHGSGVGFNVVPECTRAQASGKLVLDLSIGFQSNAISLSDS